MEYLAHTYGAFWAFNLAQATARTLIFLYVNLDLEVFLVWVGLRLGVRDLFSVWCEQADFDEV
jgi:hypothetical protein